MPEIYLLKNQHHAYLDKSNLWINSGERRQLFRTPHRDEALNMRVEWAVKHPELRIEITKVPLDEKGLPEIDLPRSPKDKDTEQLPFDDNDQVANSSARPEQLAEQEFSMAGVDSNAAQQRAMETYVHLPTESAAGKILASENASDANAMTFTADRKTNVSEDDAGKLPAQREHAKSAIDSVEIQRDELSNV
ncbi:MAG: hypothetical protein KTR17_06940 [Cellvibrionaceae bacterium]|nr:hypothetical protein [Cellvibrionaceae bacterium]